MKYVLEMTDAGKITQQDFEASNNDEAIMAGRLAIADRQNMHGHWGASGRVLDDQGKELFGLGGLNISRQ